MFLVKYETETPWIISVLHSKIINAKLKCFKWMLFEGELYILTSDSSLDFFNNMKKYVFMCLKLR